MISNPYQVGGKLLKCNLMKKQLKTQMPCIKDANLCPCLEMVNALLKPTTSCREYSGNIAYMVLNNNQSIL